MLVRNRIFLANSLGPTDQPLVLFCFFLYFLKSFYETCISSFCAELSEVLWNMVLGIGINFSVSLGPAIGAIAIFALFAFWAGQCIVVV